MQAVDQKWYVLYRWITLASAVALLVFACICWIAPSILPTTLRLTISYFSGVLAAAVILYAVVLYNRVASKRSHLEAMLVLAMIQATLVLCLMQTTGKMHSPFLVWWGGMSFVAGIFGVYGSAGSAFVTVMYFVLMSGQQNGHAAHTTVELVGLGLCMLAALVGYLFCKRFFVEADTERVALLSGELKARQRQSELLVQSLNDGVMLIDTDNTITLMNPAAAQISEWSIDEGTGSDHRLVLKLKAENGAPLETEENPLTDLLQRQTASVNTLQLIGQKGKKTIVSLVTSPIVNPKTNTIMGAIIVLRDISATHKSDKQRAEFISTASHEMRTPVAAIEGYLQLALNEKVSKIDTKARQYLEKALDSTHHLGQLFQDLLTSAKAEDGRIVSHPVVIDVGDYIEQLAETFKFSAEKHGLLVEFVLGKGANAGGEHVVRPLYYVHVDPDRLREVVTNLFDNAVKYTPSGKITVGLTGNQDVVQMFVKDTGPGIPADDVPHLFQKFYRVDNSATRTIGGTGLGLFICKKIIDLYKGRIWAESTVGQGSTFYINLPRLSTAKAEELKKTEAQSQATAPISSLTTPV